MCGPPPEDSAQAPFHRPIIKSKDIPRTEVGYRMRCNTCKGTGRVVSFSSFDYDSDGIETITCPSCKGTGVKSGDDHRETGD